jgi:integrase
MARKPQAWRGSVFRRGERLYLKTKDESGRWVQIPTPYRVGQEEEAEALLRKARDHVQASLEAAGPGVLTVAGWAKRWLDSRPQHSRWYDESRLDLHVLPVIGSLRLDEVRPRHMLDVVERARATLAPRTVRNLYGVAQAMFRDALVRDLIERTPCELRRPHLPTVSDRDPAWRAAAVFSRAELWTLTHPHPAIEPDSTVSYAVLGFAGLRHGEMAGLRWRDYEPDAAPLGRLHIWTSYGRGRTKTGAERLMPAHPVLAEILREWRSEGWASLMGRDPEPGDLILPLPVSTRRKAEAMRTKQFTYKRAVRHLKALGWRARRVHDLRRTFLSLAQEDGADPNILKRGTHAPPRDVIALYTSIEWARLCREVAKFAPNAVQGPAPKRRSPVARSAKPAKSR